MALLLSIDELSFIPDHRIGYPTQRVSWLIRSCEIRYTPSIVSYLNRPTQSIAQHQSQCEDTLAHALRSSTVLPGILLGTSPGSATTNRQFVGVQNETKVRRSFRQAILKACRGSLLELRAIARNSSGAIFASP